MEKVNKHSVIGDKFVTSKSALTKDSCGQTKPYQVAPKVMPPIYFHRNYNKEHNSTV